MQYVHVRMFVCTYAHGNKPCSSVYRRVLSVYIYIICTYHQNTESVCTHVYNMYLCMYVRMYVRLYAYVL